MKKTIFFETIFQNIENFEEGSTAFHFFENIRGLRKTSSIVDIFVILINITCIHVGNLFQWIMRVLSQRDEGKDEVEEKEENGNLVESVE